MTALPNYYERKDCRFCGSQKLELYLDLGDQPPSNSFIAPDLVAGEIRYPLKVSLCRDCSLSQLRGVVSAKTIFSDYQYLSSTSKALVNHYQSLVDLLLKRFAAPDGSSVMDIGCNDGIMLNRYPKGRFKTVGVEPSQVAAMAEKEGHQVYNEFFGAGLAKKILEARGPMRLITATNVFAHIDDIHDVAEGVRILVGDAGVFVIEAPYVVDMVEKNYFDTIYHEHLGYLGLTALDKLFRRHGLDLFDVERVDIGASGPAIRVFVQRAGGPWPRGKAADEMLAAEAAWGIADLKPYREFAGRVDKIRDELLALIKTLKAQGKAIGAYCAPAKGMTLLNTFRLGPDLVEAVSDNNAMKQGKLCPGSHIPVVSDEEFLKRMPSHALLLAWNYADFFLKNADYIKRGGKFIVPLPRPEIRP